MRNYKTLTNTRVRTSDVKAESHDQRSSHLTVPLKISMHMFFLILISDRKKKKTHRHADLGRSIGLSTFVINRNKFHQSCNCARDQLS